jgi:hypothetical protein
MYKRGLIHLFHGLINFGIYRLICFYVLHEFQVIGGFLIVCGNIGDQ